MSGRTIALGDIHGCDVALDTLLDKLAITPDDTLVILGDVIDRGPGSRAVIDRLIELQNACHLKCLMGNHEEIFFDARAGGEWSQSWLRFGGQEMLDSYGGDIDHVPDSHVEFLQDMLPYWESDQEIFVHANLEPEVALENQTPQWLRWERLTGNEPPHASGKRVVCGHTTQPSGYPAIAEGWLCIDTCVYGPGYLTALDTATNALYQARQDGTFRGKFSVEDLTT